MELDIRTGYAFTRFLTNNLRSLGGPMAELMLSYGTAFPLCLCERLLIPPAGSCQFPALGFVVDRYFRVKNFVPEPFWGIRVEHRKDELTAGFAWSRHHLFDRSSVVILYERCLTAKMAKVTKVQEKPTKKWKPLPLTTVELQKMATRFLHMNSHQAMNVAEALYNKGFISYPRTETDRFDKGMNLRALVQKQTPDGRWGQFAQNLVNGSFSQPRNGRNDDKAHPPIHPILYAAPTVLSHEEGRVYELVVRRFLACCSEDATGMATDIEISYGDESFHAHGVIVLERNYLDVYPYERWESSAQLPRFTVGERFEPTEAMVTEGKTSPPGYLTEADLIALMDANGIGTDATMAEHIQKIQVRDYVQTAERGGQPGGQAAGDDDDGAPAPRSGRGGRGTRGGRGRGRGGRGGGGAGGRGGGVRVFIPTRLGVALIEGFDRMNFETSLGKPFLRKETELQMKAICEGRITRDVVLQESLRQYRHVFHQSAEKLDVLKAVSVRKGRRGTIRADCRSYHRLAGSTSSRTQLPVDRLGHGGTTVLLRLEANSYPCGTDTGRRYKQRPPQSCAHEIEMSEPLTYETTACYPLLNGKCAPREEHVAKRKLSRTETARRLSGPSGRMQSISSQLPGNHGRRGMPPEVASLPAPRAAK